MPHALGVSIGFLVMLIAVGMGVGALIKSSEIVYNILKYLGIAYLLFMASLEDDNQPFSWISKKQ